MKPNDFRNRNKFTKAILKRVLNLERQSTSGGSGGSAFAVVGTGLPASDSTSDVFRTGRIGIGEPNPAELVDIVGTQALGKGSFKLDYTYDSGYIGRIAFAGQNVLSEVGVGANTVQGHDMEIFGAGDWAQTRAFQIMGDLTGVTPVYAGLAYTCGVANLGGSTFGAGMNVYNIGATPADRNFVAVMRINKGGGYQGNISSRMIGSDVGEDLQPTVGMSTTANGKSTSFILTPDYFRVGTLVKLEGYGENTFIEGYTHTDDVADTGTAATTIGANVAFLGVDADGNVMDVPLVNTTQRIKVSLSAAQIQALNTTPIEIIPNPGVGFALNIISSKYKLNFGTTAFDTASFISLYPSSLSINDGQSLTNTGNITSSSNVFNKMAIWDDNTVTNIVENNSILVSSDADSVGGDSTVDIYVTYEVITL